MHERGSQDPQNTNYVGWSGFAPSEHSSTLESTISNCSVIIGTREGGPKSNLDKSFDKNLLDCLVLVVGGILRVTSRLQAPSVSTAGSTGQKQISRYSGNFQKSFALCVGQKIQTGKLKDKWGNDFGMDFSQSQTGRYVRWIKWSFEGSREFGF